MLSGKNPLFIALALGLLAGLIAYSAIKAQQKKVKQGWDTVKILCALQDIPEGTELDQEMVAACDMPEKFVTESYFKVNAEDNTSKQDLPYGQRVLVPLKKGDPVLVSHFESAREAEFSTMINQKGRAVTIDVSEKNAVGLWVHPNDHVDVIGTFRETGGGGGGNKEGEQGGGGNRDSMKAVTLLQNLVVLATGHVNANTTYVPEEEKRYQTVTLLALPEEAEILTLAQETGTLTLVLRNPDDLDYQENRKVLDQKQLLSGNQANELQQKRYKTIQIIRGNKASNEGSAAPAKGE